MGRYRTASLFRGAVAERQRGLGGFGCFRLVPLGVILGDIAFLVVFAKTPPALRPPPLDRGGVDGLQPGVTADIPKISA